VGEYNYSGSNTPHRLSSVLNPTADYAFNPEYTISYTSFDKVKQIEQGTEKKIVFTYGPDQTRKKMEYHENSSLVYTRYYSGSYERTEYSSGDIKENYYIEGVNGLAAIYHIDNGTGVIYYVHTDYLGSILSLTDNNGDIVSGNQFSFDAWGRRRDISWEFTDLSTESITDRGFTGHEHIDEFNLINMNGRVYDPLTAQFLSPDNFIQSPTNSQNLNRYAYCLNNPLIYTDPDGEFWNLVIGAAIGGVVNWAVNGADFTWEGLGYFGVGAVAGLAGGAIGGAGLGMMQTATLSGAAGGAIIGGGNAFVGGGSGIDIMKSTIGGSLIGGGIGLLGSATMAGLASIGNSIDLPGMRWANTGEGINLHPTLTDWFNHHTNRFHNFLTNSGRIGSGSLFDYFIARNGTHLRIEQYQNYIDRKNAGTAPQWMLNNLSSWEKNIQIPFTNLDEYPSGIELSSLGSRNIYLGDYNRSSGGYEFSGSSMGTYNLRFDDFRTLSFGMDEGGVTSDGSPFLGIVFDNPMGIIPNHVKNVNLSASGFLPRNYERGVGISTGWLQIKVRHASHL